MQSGAGLILRDAGCPSGDETQHGRTRPVEPGQVVDDEQKRVTGRDRAQQEQDGVGDHEPFRRRAAFETERDAQGVAEIIVGKQRNGPTGTVKLAFIREYTRFENLALGNQ